MTKSNTISDFLAHGSCYKCGGQTPPDSDYCPTCGARQAPNKCPKCETKLNRTDKFCAKCGLKIQRPVTYASRSLSSGLFSLLLGWVPVIGWLMILLALVYGLLSLNRIRKGNSMDNRKAAVA
jgi:predicted amidophosphoribosyltransferase